MAEVVDAPVQVSGDAPAAEQPVATSRGITDVTHVSGCQRLFNSILCAICFAPLLFVLAMWLLGYNEQRAVCEQRAISEGSNVVQQVGCDSPKAGNGELVMFSCDLSEDGLVPIELDGTPFEFNVTTTGLRVQSEMLQCVEESHSETQNDVAGGGQTTVTTYTYSRVWKSSRVPSENFRDKGSSSFLDKCGAENPAWPTDVPTSETIYVDTAMVGSFEIGVPFTRKIPLTTPVSASSTPSGWTTSGVWYQSSQWVDPRRGQIGKVRVAFEGNDWSSPLMTVIGENNGGQISSWIASDSWLCSGFALGDLRAGSYSKAQLFSHLKEESHVLTVFLRIVGFLIAWFAISRCCGPLGVAADCIPFVGKYLGNAIEAIACCISCPMACSCSLGVIGVVWVAMRPLVGIPLMLIFCLALGSFVAFEVMVKSKKQESAETADSPDLEAAENAEAPAEAAAAADGEPSAESGDGCTDEAGAPIASNTEGPAEQAQSMER